MIRRQGDRLLVSGALTLASVKAVLLEGSTAIGQGVRSVDLGEVDELDSSALALLIAWLREAKRLKRALVFTNLPPGLTTIARLYGVADLLCVSQATGSPAAGSSSPASSSHH
ncbi:MAG: STAS domain-containing protein [Betaproteobacteria bacterium]|nr:STAS domain-containing protein [Betaproteobacteria bacterium]MSQ87877.1 STAS domain-containing protein [Betaproteobacteria bacterium]